MSKCFNEKDSIQIRLTLPYSIYSDYGVDKELLSAETSLADTILQEIRKKTKEFSLRFSEPLITISNDGNLYAFVRILPRPEPIKMFTFIPNTFLSEISLATYTNVSTISQCADLCVSNVKCLSFDFFTRFSCKIMLLLFD